MVLIRPFEVEGWLDKYENTPGVLNISETCSAPITLDELQGLSSSATSSPLLDASRPLTYGAIRGSEQLRELVNHLHVGEGHDPKNVIITQGAIAANFLVFYALVGKGDHVICAYPTFQQLYSVPESLGAEVTLWKLKPENGFIPDVSELAQLVKSNTKMIVINNPNNPSGAAIPTQTLKGIIDFAKERDIIVLSDEVYRPLFHELDADGADIPPPATSLGYPKTIVTGSMSKAYALAGIRIGWVAAYDESIAQAIGEARSYTTISVSQLDDQIAQYALSPEVYPRLMTRNSGLARQNLELLETFVKRYPSVCSWVKPNSGSTAFIQFRKNKPVPGPVDDVSFCLDVLEKTKVMLVPGSKCFGEGKDFEGYVRIGYACSNQVLIEALQKLGSYVEQHLL